MESAHPRASVQSEPNTKRGFSHRKEKKNFPAASGLLTGAADEQGLAEAQHSGQQEPQATVHGPLWPPAGSCVLPRRDLHGLVCWVKPAWHREKNKNTVRNKRYKQTPRRHDS